MAAITKWILATQPTGTPSIRLAFFYYKRCGVWCKYFWIIAHKNNFVCIKNTANVTTRDIKRIASFVFYHKGHKEENHKEHKGIKNYRLCTLQSLCFFVNSLVFFVVNFYFKSGINTSFPFMMKDNL